MRRRIFIGIGVLFALTLLLGLFALAYTRGLLKKRETSVVLPDSSVLTYKGVTFGTNHIAPEATAWESLARHFPQFVQTKLGLKNIASFTTPQPELVIWLQRSGAVALTSPMECVVKDEQGYLSSASSMRFSSGALGKSTLEAITVSAFPRRQKSFQVCLYLNNYGGKAVPVVAEFTVENPLPQNYPEWKPQPLPAVAVDRDMEFALTKVKVGIHAEGTNSALNFSELRQSQLNFRVRQNGKITHEWNPEGLEMIDATGNHLNQTGWSGYPSHDEEVMEYYWPLFPSEKVWKLKAEFIRRADAKFSQSELLVIPGIAVPKPGEVTPGTLKTNLQGVIVEFMGVVSKSGQLTNHHRMFGGTDSVEFRMSPVKAGLHLTFISAVDEQGHALQTMGAGHSQTDYGFGLEFPTNAHTLTITVAVQKGRFVEYLVKPETK